MLSRTPIGGLLLDAVEGWAFSVQDGILVGRRVGDPGILRINHRASNVLAQPVTHEQCFEVAADFAGVSTATPTRRRTTENVTGPVGSATFLSPETFTRLWYCCRPAGLIVGVYSCPSDALQTIDHRLAVAQCGHMITSAIFDRPSWGGDDIVTRIMIAQLAGADQADLGAEAKLDAQVKPGEPTDTTQN